MNKKLNEKLALSVYLDNDLSDEDKISAIGFVYLAKDILGKEIQDLDKCYYADAKKCFDQLLPADNERCLAVRNYYGLDGRKNLTLQEVGLKYGDGVTRERIRQVLNEQIKSLRRLKRSVEINYVFNKKEYYRQMNKLQGSNKDNNYQYLLIEDLDLSNRTRNCLKRAKIKNVSELIELNIPEILNGFKIKHHNVSKIRNMGQKSFEELMTILIELGY